VHTGQELVHGLGLPVIGNMPLIPQRVMRRLGDQSEKHRYWRTRLSESVDAITAVLLRRAQIGDDHVVMVSSATAGEGKTTLASNLAWSLASSGNRTVLVDFDLRRPAIHRVLGLELQPGIYDVLRDPQMLDSSLQPTQVPNLTFLAAGWCDSKGISGLTTSSMKVLFDNLRSRFDFVVVDGSPILPVVDTRLIAQHVVAVVLSVLSDVSRVWQVRRACQLLESFAIPICGVVVTGSRNEAYSDTYYETLTLSEAL
jgi:succinoglycan biosynthesis transport protein ExoP